MTMPDFRQMTEQMKKLTVDLERVREEFESIEVHGSSPGGRVRVTMRAGKLDALWIDPAAMEQAPTRLAEEILGAVRDCEANSTQMLGRSTGPMTEAMEKLIGELG
ncbi:YbaB/EbfC family nucleoid-associated protein [Micromonospora sp. NPDC049366]|uniref:YbaB/EbfC family nucleoid-associated protein n=1 Tax=Micromonospora sp. NPDC049366 TaxID=3364271 RepID=UPI0037B97997